MKDPKKANDPNCCPGCGVPFQQEDPETPGFIPPTVVIGKDTICRRCFRLVHYRQATKAALSDELVLGMIRKEMEQSDGAIQFVDAFQPSPNPLLDNLLEEWGKPTLKVINKYDMISGWFRSGGGSRRLAEILGISKDSALTMNALDHASVKKVTSWIGRRFPCGSRIMLVGPVNSGKTTFLRSACSEAHLASRFPDAGNNPGAGHCLKLHARDDTRRHSGLPIRRSMDPDPLSRLPCRPPAREKT